MTDMFIWLTDLLLSYIYYDIILYFWLSEFHTVVNNNSIIASLVKW